MGGINRRIMVQAGLGKNARPWLNNKNNNNNKKKMEAGQAGRNHG
jgi:hypothetical protein